ncbi:hypothetical protein Ccar_06345 [Clostridium carboxidivorans P7]|nr:DUF1294 domain-containing protein [Clostridium carboxidivorans]AKN30463.1 hypothetical protein Ccar_06345 [Clostridium carboxidivorans P7]EFG86204.1 hypothetical protein CLCAR_4023 [Clostridium carboxidivorans P7]
MKFFLCYILVINLYGIFLMHSDKSKSQKGKWRIPEKTLFITALLLGSPGILIGMYLFRHKTKHKRFTIGIPLILIVQVFIFAKYFSF